jgi:hypothetical protein
MTVFVCTVCKGRRCLFVAEVQPDHETCPTTDTAASWQQMDDEIAEAILLGVAEQERRRSQ